MFAHDFNPLYDRGDGVVEWRPYRTSSRTVVGEMYKKVWAWEEFNTLRAKVPIAWMSSSDVCSLFRVDSQRRHLITIVVMGI